MHSNSHEIQQRVVDGVPRNMGIARQAT
jgi:hypothetical protein